MKYSRIVGTLLLSNVFLIVKASEDEEDCDGPEEIIECDGSTVSECRGKECYITCKSTGEEVSFAILKCSN